METLTPEQANQLIRVRDSYAGITCRTDAECTILQLLKIIDGLEMSANLSRPSEPEGCIFVIRGYYTDAPGKLMHVLQFAIISGDNNKDAIMKDIKARYGTSLLRGFDIISYETYPARERMFLCGTGLGG